MPEEDKDQYVVLLCTRQYDPEITKELVKGIWNEPFNSRSKPHAHVHETIPFKTSNAEIKEKIENVLLEVKAYRDKEYPLKLVIRRKTSNILFSMFLIISCCIIWNLRILLLFLWHIIY